MREAFLDVVVDVPATELLAMPDADRFVIETSRVVAEEKCVEARAELRTDRSPEFVVRHGQHRITLVDTFQFCSRWAVRVPGGCAGRDGLPPMTASAVMAAVLSNEEGRRDANP